MKWVRWEAHIAAGCLGRQENADSGAATL